MTMDLLRISIFDDEPDQQSRWVDRLENLDQVEVTTLGIDDFKNEVSKLEERRRNLRKCRENVEKLTDLGIESAFDDIDIFIVDYDLLGAVELTGEEIAYLLRCFSTCGIIVALNQFGTKSFDLTLGGHPESFADLNVGSDYFDDPGLWKPEEWSEFRPWSWPLLPKLYRDYKLRVEDLRDKMNTPILDFLALDQSKAGILPYTALEFIQQSKKLAEETTFEGFVTGSSHGLRKRDTEYTIRELEPRIAAARLHRWIESFILGGQEILVDAPHLVSRYASLLDGSISDEQAWNQTARVDVVDGLDEEILSATRYERSHWLSRPAWYWNQVRKLSTIAEVADPWDAEDHRWVFCEDTSKFIPSNKARSFASDLPSSFSRRYVQQVSEVDYHPSVRFSI